MAYKAGWWFIRTFIICLQIFMINFKLRNLNGSCKLLVNIAEKVPNLNDTSSIKCEVLGFKKRRKDLLKRKNEAIPVL